MRLPNIPEVFGVCFLLLLASFLISMENMKAEAAADKIREVLGK